MVGHDPGVSLRWLYLIFRQLLGLVLLMGRPASSKDIELIVLRQEAAVLRRTKPRARLDWADRAVFVALVQRLPRALRRHRPGACLSAERRAVEVAQEALPRSSEDSARQRLIESAPPGAVPERRARGEPESALCCGHGLSSAAGQYCGSTSFCRSYGGGKLPRASGRGPASPGRFPSGSPTRALQPSHPRRSRLVTCG